MGREKKLRRKEFQATPKTIKEAFKLNEKLFRWSFEKCHWEHKGWQDFKELRKFVEQVITKLQELEFVEQVITKLQELEFVEQVITKLQELEKMSWQEILDASGGKSAGHGNNNHFIGGQKLPAEERRIFIERGYMRDFEKVFSLRLSGKERLIGVVDLNVFKILWYDKEHRFFKPP